jgi:biopolymer transport protein ExbD
MAKRSAPEVNAGSMADIAFLLLIFFLVTTTIETDSGISRKLPPIEDVEDPPIIKQKNIFTVVVNRDDRLLVEDDLMELKNLRAAAVAFLDNGGGSGDEACNYCKGKKDPSSSDNPTKAIISLQNDRFTSYNAYISVQNELVAAYNELRNREAQRLFGMDFTAMENFAKDGSNYNGNKDKLKDNIERIKLMYPQKLSEAEPKK